MAVATRRPAALDRAGGWGETRLPLSGPYVDVLTGARHEGSVRLSELLATYPAALLIR